MGDPLPPDPYRALGVERNATAAQIKTAYRKLALKCHPDKVADKGDEFHKISQAYELIGEDEARRKYDDTVRLDSLRREVYDRRSGSGPNVEVRTAAFDVRTNPAPGGRFTARGAERYEERRPKERSTPYEEDTRFDDGYFDMRASSRKYDGYEASPRKPPPNVSPKEEMFSRSKSDKAKINPRERERQKKKQNDKDFARERRRQNFSTEDLSSEDDTRFENLRRFDGDRSRFGELPPERRRSEESFIDERTRKMRDQTESIKEYMARSQDVPLGGPPRRTNSYQEQEPRKSDSRERERRPSAFVRKAGSKPTSSSKKPGKGGKSSDSDRERDNPEPIPAAERRMPSFNPSRSSPSEIKIPEQRRSRGSYDEYDARPVPPRVNRAETMPSSPTRDARGQAAGPRRDSTTPIYSSNLRHTETNDSKDSGYSTSNSPTEAPTPQMPTSKKYYYGESSKNDDSTTVNVEYDNTNGYSTAFREPPSARRTSPPSPQRTSSRDARPPPRRQGSSQSYPQSPVPQSPQAPSQSQKSQMPSSATSSRRPSIQRNNSGNNHQQPRRAPDIKTTGRNASMPLPIRTSSGNAGNVSSGKNDGYFFGELRQGESPTEMRFEHSPPDFGPTERGPPPVSSARDRERDRDVRDRDRDRGDRDRDRARDRDFPSNTYRYIPEGPPTFAKRFTPDDVKYTSYNATPPPPQTGRKGSGSAPGYDYTDQGGLSEKTARAQAYMEKMAEEGAAGPGARSGGSGRFGLRREATMA